MDDTRHIIIGVSSSRITVNIEGFNELEAYQALGLACDELDERLRTIEVRVVGQADG